MLLILVVFLSFSIRLGELYWPETNLLWIVLIVPIIAIPIFKYFGLYQTIIRFIGDNAIWEIVKSVSLYALLWGILVYFSAVEGVPRSVILINWMLSLIAIGGIRMITKWLVFELMFEGNFIRKNVVIYGAGAAGRQLALSLQDSADYKPMAFIDDLTSLHGQSIHGLKIISKEDLKDFIGFKNISEILLAIPSLSRFSRNGIINYLESLPIHVLSLPSLEELAKGKVKIHDLREVSIKDILGRNHVSANKNLIGLNIKDKVVMVTGAGGSIGTELCLQILKLNPKIIILYEQSEFALYKLGADLAKLNDSKSKIISILGSVKNKNRLMHIFKKFEVQTIYHAAAYKHVPLVEFNTTEGIDNNVFGTLNCAVASLLSGVETFVLISTDKAVRPTNTMGASKRLAELILQALSNNPHEFIQLIDSNVHKKTIYPLNITKFSIVRFGNVLNSSGSVVPLFKQQIKEGGPVTVTDPNVLRYFMTVSEAVELVIQAGAMGQGGEVFVLNMGKPELIYNLAKKMIRLSGMSIKNSSDSSGDIEIIFTGLRPGEKLVEELLIGGNISPTDNPMIMKASENSLSSDDLKLFLDELKSAIINNDHEKLRQSLISSVEGFKPESKISDNLYNA